MPEVFFLSCNSPFGTVMHFFKILLLQLRRIRDDKGIPVQAQTSLHSCPKRMILCIV